MSKTPKVKFNGDQPQENVLRAKIPTTLIGDKVTLTHRAMAYVQTGVSVKVEDGYFLCFSLVQELSNKGMMAINSPGNITNGEITVGLLNCGREIISVKNGDPLIDVWLEKIQKFEWETI